MNTPMSLFRLLALLLLVPGVAFGQARTSTAPGITQITGDCTASGSFSVAITCLKTNGVAFTPAATTAIGTSGATIPLLSTANIWTLAQSAPSFIGSVGPSSFLGNIFLGVEASSPTKNGAEIIPSATGQRPTLQFTGIDANRGDQIWSQGTGGIFLGSGTNNNAVGSLDILDCGGSCINPLLVSGGTSGNPAQISSLGGIKSTSSFSILPAAITWSGSTKAPVFSLNVNNFGSTTAAAPSAISLTTIDDIDASGVPNGATSIGLNLIDAYGGNSTTKGGKSALIATATDNQGITADQGTDNYYVGGTFYSTRIFTQGGTATTNLGAKGRVFGDNPVSQCFGTATNLYECTGAEIDVEMGGTASTFFRTGLNIANLGSTGAQGAGVDAGMIMYGGGGGVAQFMYGVAFASPVNSWPIDNTNGTILGVYPTVAASNNSDIAKWGIDFAPVSFPSTGNAYDGGFLRSNGFSVDGIGMVRIGSCYFTWIATGLIEDCKGSVGNIANGATAISNGGSGFPSNAHTAATDQYGGVYNLTIAGGVATSVIVETQPVFPAQTGLPTTIALTASVANPGTGVVLTASWNSTSTALSLNPSGGSVKIGGATVLPNLSGTTGSIGGSPLLAGACAAGTVAVTGATSAMVAGASPAADPDSALSTGIAIYAFVSSANTVTVRVCAIVAVTPTAVAYNVRVIQ